MENMERVGRRRHDEEDKNDDDDDMRHFSTIAHFENDLFR